MSLAVKGWDGNTYDSNSQEKSEPGFIRQQLRFVLSGSYSTGGDTCALPNAGVESAVPVGVTNISQLVRCQIRGMGPASSVENNGGKYVFIPGTTLANGKVKIFATAGTEYAAGAYGTDATGDLVQAELTWKR